MILSKFTPVGSDKHSMPPKKTKKGKGGDDFPDSENESAPTQPAAKGNKNKKNKKKNEDSDEETAIVTAPVDKSQGIQYVLISKYE